MEMKPQQIWAMVTIVFILVAATTTLVILDKDVSVILTLVALVALPVLGALGGAVYQKMSQVKENSDENMHRVLSMHQKSTDQLTNLALSMTPPPVPTEGEGTKTQETR
jgi:hypothetical protein